MIEYMAIIIPNDLMRKPQKVGFWRASEVLADENVFGDRVKMSENSGDLSMIRSVLLKL